MAARIDCRCKASVIQLWKRYHPSTSDSNAFITWKHQQSARRADDVDEYFCYIREPPVPHGHIKQRACSWWLEERQQRLYPNLSKMALDILTIPAMSAAPERLFSSANITISGCCNRFHGDTTEAIECLKSWRKIENIRLESGSE